ncbi:MFS transporter [Pedobacter nutrimenti]|jgi:predicted MFS family arabinose efflux permease|uniref:Putative MFS family arabinose efflux permease n=1 Tax=Pedobacter nutrimenti TaxID=1241337 RepID=A0A318UNW4_9SPHI|nr:MFS transporter [Pedobacter nutrimenti]PYF77230.1 putative MFS family arabinose efflux permease [Pedobacter nutrimenti]
MTKRIAYVGCLGVIGIISTEFGVIGILPQIAAHYHITIDKAGLLLSAFALVIALTGPFMTLVTSGYDRKKLMYSAIAVFLITGVVSAMAPPFWLLVLVRILPAFLQPVYISNAIAAAVSSGHKKQEHQLMGIVLGGIAISMVTTVPFATYIASIFTWKASFIVQTFISAMAFIAILKFMPPMPSQQKKSFGSQLKILRIPAFLISVAMNFFMISAWFSTYSYFADYLGKAKEMDPQMVSYMLFLFGLTGIVSNWVAGKMLGKSIPKTTAFFLTGTILIPIALFYSGANTWTTIAVIALWGFMYAPCFLNAAAYMISAAPGALEFANSLAVSFGNLGVTTGTFLSGLVIARQGIVFAPWVGMCFGILALLMILLRTQMEKRKLKPQLQH